MKAELGRVLLTSAQNYVTIPHQSYLHLPPGSSSFSSQFLSLNTVQAFLIKYTSQSSCFVWIHSPYYYNSGTGTEIIISEPDPLIQRVQVPAAQHCALSICFLSSLLLLFSTRVILRCLAFCLLPYRYSLFLLFLFVFGSVGYP
jgi:hypothetical protein